MAITGDEGRSSLRKAAGRWQATFDPQISEWGNPLLGGFISEYIGNGGEPGELKHLSSWRKRNQPRFRK